MISCSCGLDWSWNKIQSPFSLRPRHDPDLQKMVKVWSDQDWSRVLQQYQLVRRPSWRSWLHGYKQSSDRVIYSDCRTPSDTQEVLSVCWGAPSANTADVAGLRRSLVETPVAETGRVQNMRSRTRHEKHSHIWATILLLLLAKIGGHWSMIIVWRVHW